MRPALFAAVALAVAIAPVRALASDQDAPPGPRVPGPRVITLPSLDELFARVVTPPPLRARGIALVPMLGGTSMLGLIVRGSI